MSFIAQFGGPRSEQVWPLILVLLCACACSRPGGAPPNQSPVASAHQAPFQTADSAASDADPDTALAASNQTPGNENSPPFHDVETLPVGTLLTVRLTSPVYAETSISSASFKGVLAEPVVLGGTTAIPRGATVVGLVESVRASEVKPGRGYVRLILQSVHVGDSEIPLHTASLFAPQAPSSGAKPSLVRLEKGRQLTFRLSEPAHSPDQEPKKLAQKHFF